MNNRTLSYPILHLSPFFEKSKRSYYDCLQGVRYGDWNSWITYFLYGCTYQAKRTIDKIDKIENLVTDWINKNKKHEKIILHISSNVYVSVNKIVKDLNIPYTTEKLASFPTVNPAFLLPFHFTQSFEKSGKGHKLYSYVLSTKTIVAISATLSYIPQSDHGSIFFLPMVVTTVLEKKNA